MGHALESRLPVLRRSSHVPLATGRIDVLERRDEVHELRMEVARLQNTLQAIVLAKGTQPAVVSVHDVTQTVEPAAPGNRGKQDSGTLGAVRSVMRYLAD